MINATFAILICESKDKVKNKFKNEVIKSFEDRISVVYEIDINTLTDAELSGVISDITGIMDYDKTTLVTPTLIVIKKGDIVIKQEGLIYREQLNKKLDSKNIE